MLQETNVERYMRNNKSNLVQHLLLAKVKNRFCLYILLLAINVHLGFFPHSSVSSCANRCNSLSLACCFVSLLKHWSIIWCLSVASRNNWGWTLHPNTGQWKHSHSSSQLGDIRCSIQETVFTRPCSHYCEEGRETEEKQPRIWKRRHFKRQEGVEDDRKL